MKRMCDIADQPRVLQVRGCDASELVKRVAPVAVVL